VHIDAFPYVHFRLILRPEIADNRGSSCPMYKEKFRQKTSGLAVLPNATPAAGDCTDGLDLPDKLNE